MIIAQLTTGRDINGAVRHCLDLTNELAAAGHHVLLMHRPESWIESQPIHANVERIVSPLRRNRNCLSQIATRMRQANCKLVHTHMSGASFFGVLLARFYHFRSVATCHMPHFQPHWWWNDRIIVPCRSVMRFQRFCNAVPKSRIDVIPNFINPNRLLSDEERASVRSQLGIADESFVIGVIGSLQKRKGMRYMLPALVQLKQKGYPVCTLSIGPQEPVYAAEMRQAIESLGLQENVRLLGQRDDIPKVLKALDCVCLPSLKEVMPISLLEAMATGLPALATRVGGVPDCVRDGVDGWIVPPKNSNAVYMSIRKWLDDRPQLLEMGQNARAFMMDHFSPNALVPKILNTYSQALGESVESRA